MSNPLERNRLMIGRIESAPVRRNNRGNQLSEAAHWRAHPEDFVRVNEAPVEPGTSDPDAEESPQEVAKEEATQGATTPADARAGQECLDGATVTRPGGPDAKSKGDKFDPPPGAESVRKGDHALVVYGAETSPATDKLGNELQGKPVKANAKALQKYLQDKGAIVTVYPGDSKFLEWFNSQKDGAFNAGFFLGHNDTDAFKMNDGTKFKPEDAAQMRSGVMTKGATWTWAGCGTANSGTVNDFVSVSWFNQSGTTWGERGGRGYFDVVDWKNSQRPTVGTGISFPEGGSWEGVAPLNGGAR